MSEVLLTERLETSIEDTLLLHSLLKAQWGDAFAGISRAGATTWAHFTTATRPASWQTVVQQLDAPLLVTVGDNKTTIVANDSDSTTIVVADPRIVADTLVEYYVDFNDVLDTTATDAPVTAGRVELLFKTPEPGLYRVRIHRKNSAEMGSAVITAT